MTNNHTITPLDLYPELKRLFDRIDQHSKRIVSMSDQSVFNDHESMMPVDLFFMGIIHRTRQLTQAFTYLVLHWNYTTSGAILRLHLDSLIKVAYISQAEDADAIVKQIVEGVDFRKMKDAHGNPLTDTNLFAYVERFMPRAKEIYHEASSLIHFSEKFIYIESDDESWPKQSIIELLETYIEITRIILLLVDNWLETNKD